MKTGLSLVAAGAYLFLVRGPVLIDDQDGATILPCAKRA